MSKENHLYIKTVLSMADFIYLTQNFLCIANTCEWQTFTVHTVHLL